MKTSNDHNDDDDHNNAAANVNQEEAEEPTTHNNVLQGILKSISQRTVLEEQQHQNRSSESSSDKQLPMPHIFASQWVQDLWGPDDAVQDHWHVKQVHGVPVHVLTNIPYYTTPVSSDANSSKRQCLDLYFPPEDNASDGDATEPKVNDDHGENASGDASEGTPSGQQEQQEEVQTTADTRPASPPIYIHIHGGGWSRGGKGSPLYGGPALCQHAAVDGCLAVAVGYRLGRYPEFVHDAAQAIAWVYHKQQMILGEDEDDERGGIFLSGHSAGAHIASLLLLRHDHFLQPLGVPMDWFRGVVLVSGVYDLFSPLKANVIDFKNKWLQLAYVTPAFGKDNEIKRQASPLLLLDPDKDTSILGTAATKLLSGTAATKLLSHKEAISKRFSSLLSAASSEAGEQSAHDDDKTKGEDRKQGLRKRFSSILSASSSEAGEQSTHDDEDKSKEEDGRQGLRKRFSNILSASSSEAGEQSTHDDEDKTKGEDGNSSSPRKQGLRERFSSILSAASSEAGEQTSHDDDDKTKGEDGSSSPQKQGFRKRFSSLLSAASSEAGEQTPHDDDNKTKGGEGSSHSRNDDAESCNKDNDAEGGGVEENDDRNTSNPLPWNGDLPPNILVLNATFDMGLQENGKLMAEAMSKYTNVEYQIIDGSDHASICWHGTTQQVISDFIHRCRNAGGSATTSVPDDVPPATAAQDESDGHSTNH